MRVLFSLFLIHVAVAAFSQTDDSYSPNHFNRLYASLYNISTSGDPMEVKREKTFQALEATIKKYPKEEKNFALIRDAVNLSVTQLSQLIGIVDTSIYGSAYKAGADYTLRRVMVSETGKPFPSLVLTDTAMRPFVIDSLAGNIVLIDVWSAWCKPCRQQMPELLKLYNKYHDGGFEIIGISLDEKKDDWLKAVAKDKQIWPQFCELTSWSNNKFASRFFIEAIPSNFLLDKNGVILGQDLSPGQVEQLLRQQLN